MNEERSGEELAVHALRIGAIRVNPLQPFLWASGYYMPIYNDNRLFLGHEDAREHIIKRLAEKVFLSKSEVIAGTSTAGIPWASFVADRLKLPMIYVRDKPKEHGLKNQIEGIAADKTLEHKQVSLIEDLVSTGGSSVKAVQAIRDAEGNIVNCFSIFNYGFVEARNMFEGIVPFEGNRCLSHSCVPTSLLGYNALLDVAQSKKYIDQEQADMLADWRTSPFTWGARNGFPPVKK